MKLNKEQLADFRYVIDCILKERYEPCEILRAWLMGNKKATPIKGRHLD
jgi:hypothetical protein